MQQPEWPLDRVPLVPSLLVTASAALLLSGCAGGDVTARVAPPARPGSAGPSAPAVPLTVTPRQRGYLDALSAAGVRRSTELMALSIGSYVCQGRAAGQSDEAVWDFVFPLVRGDIHDLAVTGSGTALAAPAMSAADATARYIRMATERLC